MFEHQSLYFCRPHFEARGIDHALQTVGDEEVTVFVHTTQIARTEKAFAIQFKKRSLRGIGTFPITVKHLGAVNHNFTRFTLGQLFQSFRVHHARIGAHERNAQTLLLGVIRWVVVRGCSCFGQTIAFAVTQAIQIKQTLRHRLRHSSTTTTDGNQTLQIEFVKVRTAQQINHHGGNVGPMRHLPFRNQTASEFTVPTRHHHRCRTQINCGMHHAGQASDMEHRHRQQSHIFMRAATPNSRGNGVVHDGAMRVHATFW